MSDFTIEGFDPALERALRVRAAENGRSAADEARAILSATLQPPNGHLFLEMHRRIVAEDLGTDLEPMPREPATPITFE